MADDGLHPSKDKPGANSYIPPPTDPYVTYQTPFPRRPSEDVQNPFIEFRRLADSVFSSFFSALPRVLGTEKFKEANIREADEEFVKVFDRQAKEFESRIAEMVRVRTEEAEGLRKKLEQEWEERRRENEKRMEEESKRWEMMNRGLERCPGLRPGGLDAKSEPQSELDLYDGLKAYESASYKPKTVMESRKYPRKEEGVDKKCPWNEDEEKQDSWLANLGWDGRRRAKNITLYAPKQQGVDQTRKVNVDWQQYKDEEMDPFNDDDHLVPWLKLSPYSPLSLIKDQAWKADSNRRHGAESISTSLSDLPWDEAFEDLIAVHKTGRLPSLVRRLVYWGGPNQWMTDMALRGSLGSRWEEGFMVAALMGAVDGKRWRGFDGLKEQCIQLAGREFRKTTSPIADPEECEDDEDCDDDYDEEDEEHPEDWVSLFRGAFEPAMLEAYREIEGLADALFENARPIERAYGARGMSWPTPEEVISAILEGNLNLDDSTSDKQLPETAETNPDLPPTSHIPTTATKTSARSSEEENSSDGVVSVVTRIVSKTQPDGSIETTRSLRKQFVDGREEHEESTETTPAPKVTQKKMETQPLTDNKRVTERKGGWFWN